MPVEEGTGNQPQSTETTSDAERHSSFLGTGYQHEITSEQEPAPTDAEQAEDAIAQVTEGTDEQQETGEAEQPTGPGWLEDYPKELLDKAQRRYPSAFKRLMDGTATVDDQMLVRDKLNTDLEYLQRQEGESEEPTLQDEPDPTTQAAPVTPEQQRQDYYKSIDNFVAQSIDPVSAEQLGKDLLAGFGVDTNSDDPEVQALVKNASKVGMTLAKGAVDLNMTILPRMLSNLVEQQFPGFAKMYEKSALAMTWDEVRAKEVDGQRPYENLPAYGTAEFKSALREAARQVPNFDEMVFRNPKTGQPYAWAEQNARKYEYLARIAAGKKVNPAEVRDAVETGKRLAQRTEKTRAAGKALGAGRAKPDSAPAKDDLNSSIINAYKSHRGSGFGDK